jgi:hypothetical protein
MKLVELSGSRVGEYQKDRINELETKNKNIRDLYRGINEFKKGYKPRSNLVKHENGDLLADSHNTLNRLKNYCCQLLNVHGVNYVRQTEIHTAESLLAEPSGFEVEIAIEKLKKYKSSCTDTILAELTQAGGNTIRSEIHKFINKKELPQQWKESITVNI